MFFSYLDFLILEMEVRTSASGDSSAYASYSSRVTVMSWLCHSSFLANQFRL